MFDVKIVALDTSGHRVTILVEGVDELPTVAQVDRHQPLVGQLFGQWHGREPTETYGLCVPAIGVS